MIMESLKTEDGIYQRFTVEKQLYSIEISVCPLLELVIEQIRAQSKRIVRLTISAKARDMAIPRKRRFRL